MKWSANNWIVYSFMGIVPWAVVYNLFQKLFGLEYRLEIALPLLGMQLLALLLLILSNTVFQKYS